MGLLTGRRWSRTLAGAILAGFLLAPSAARADCGDHVQIDRHTSTPREQAPVPPAPQPCSGPHCSRGTPVPLAPPVTVVPVQAQDVACLSGDIPGTGDVLSTSLHEFPVSLPECHGSSIYHPPRPLR